MSTQFTEDPLIIPQNPRRRGTLNELRRQFPDQVWRAVRDGMNWEYETLSGWSAGWRSCLAPKWDGDDESCVSRIFIYRPDGPTMEVFL